MEANKFSSISSEEEGEDAEMEAEIKEEGEVGFFAQEAAGSDSIRIHRMMGPTTMRKSRPKEEKERTKLRERHRRAITARILSGLKRHGNYNLRVRADINDVIAALAREAGWVVLPDGTTFLNSNLSSSNLPTQGGKAAVASVTSVSTVPSITPVQTPPLRVISSSSSGCKVCHLKGAYTPSAIASQDAQLSSVYSMCLSNENLVMDANRRIHEHDYAGTAYVPLYVMLPLGVINMKSELVDPEGLVMQLRTLKSIDVDGVIVNCWWGIVEAHAPNEYNWHGYKRLFQIVKDFKLKLQVVMSFHECGGNLGDDVCIPLPHWVAEVGRSNPDIYFTDKDRRRNPECLSFGIDKERVLRGRTAIEAYFDCMRSFRIEFDEIFEDGYISQIEIGLGPCGELRYPSNPVKHGWRYPGIGEFQCYDKYLMKSLRKRAEAKGHPFWARGPNNAGFYNSKPHETEFFCDGGDYDSYHGRFFLTWYSDVLIDHADYVLSLAKLVFEGVCITAKIPAVHWWYRTISHAAESTAGFYNPSNRDGYASVAAVLKKHGTSLKFTCLNSQTLSQQQELPGEFADAEGLIWQVLNAAWDICLPLASENVFPCYEREGYNQILETAKPKNDPDERRLSHFTYRRLSPLLMEQPNLVEFERFVKRMHGEAVVDLQV